MLYFRISESTQSFSKVLSETSISSSSNLQQIVDVIPNFYDDMDDIDDSSMPLPPFDDEDDEIDDDDFCVANERKSTVIYSRELDSKASNVSEGNLG